MKTLQVKCVCLLLLAWLCIPLQVTDATASRMNTQDIYKLLKAGDSALVRSLKSGEREIFLATMAMNRGKTKQALLFLTTEAVKKNRLAALIKAEAYRQQSVQAADRAGHYAHAVNDDIGKLKKARITSGLDEANKRLTAFVARANRAKPALLRPVADKPAVAPPVRKVSAPVVPVKTVSVQPPKPHPVVKIEQPIVVNVAKAKQVKLKLTTLKPAASPQPVVERKVVTSQAGVSQSVLEALEVWRKDWASLDSDAYLSHYHKAFKTLKHDYNSWASYKRRVNGKKSYIKVALSNIKVIPSQGKVQKGEAALVTFNQRYQSSNYNAVSRKQLYMARKNSSEPWLILYEGDGR